MMNSKVLTTIRLFLSLMVSIVIMSSDLLASNPSDDVYIVTLEQRLASEEKLAQNSKNLSHRIESEINNILQNVKVENAYKISAKNNIYDQLQLQSTKFNLQGHKIRTDRDAVLQEIIANENAIFQLEGKLQGIIGPGKQVLTANDTSLNFKIKELQKAISYHKTILEINNKRLKVLNSYYENIIRLQKIQEDALSKLKLVVEEYTKQNSLNILNIQELEFGKRIDDLLGLELEYKNQIQELDIVRLESSIDTARYSKLYYNIVDVVSKRAFLETELGFLRFNSRLEEIAGVFPIQHKEEIKNKNLSEKLDRVLKEALALQYMVAGKMAFIKEYIAFIKKDMQQSGVNELPYASTLALLEDYGKKYNDFWVRITNTVKDLNTNASDLKKLFQGDISVRQSLPDNWLELQALAHDIVNIPYLLSKQALVSWLKLNTYFADNPGLKVLELLIVEALIIVFVALFFRLIALFNQRYSDGKDKRFSHLSFYVLSTFAQKNRFIIAILFNFFALCWFTNTSGVFINILLMLSSLYLMIKFVINFCYIFLIENTIEISGDDSRLYRGLKYSLIFGGALYALTILGSTLSLSLNTQGFIDRLFMLFLLAISYPLIINWQVVPQLIVDNLRPKPYVRKAIWLLGIIVPVTILSNATLGIIGYVNLAWKIAIAEFQLSIVITLWLISKGVIGELMEITSVFFIRNVTNGWLWTESVLKPLSTLINFILLLVAVFCLIVVYGLNNSGEYVVFLHKTLNYKLFVLHGETPEDTAEIYVSSLIIFFVIFAFVIWATKWSREFAYRWLYAKVNDLAVRNSLSVFTQYATLVIGILLILKVLQVPTTSLMVTIGGLLFFLGFGLRDIIGNYISGIILLIERQVRAGDIITVGEFEGKVTKIGMRSITVEAFDNMEVIVPNTDTITKPLINWTYKDTIIRLDFTIRLSYEENLEHVRDIILAIFKDIDDVIAVPEPNVFFRELSDSAVVGVVYYYIDIIRTPSRAAVRTTVMLAILKALNANNIKIAYPKQKIDFETKQPSTSLIPDDEKSLL